MNSEVEKLCKSLDTLATAVINAYGNDSVMTEGLGWNAPALTRYDLAHLPKQLASDLRMAGPDELDDETKIIVQDFPRRLQLLQTHTVPQVFSGNSGQAVAAYTATLSYLRQLFARHLDWQVINDPKSMPAGLAKRVRALDAQIDQLVPRKDELERQLEEIRRAHSAAESLPIDLQTLAEARKTLADAVTKADEEMAIIHSNTSTSVGAVKILEDLQGQATQILVQCEEAYRASTTRGLASAFEERSAKLGHTMIAWVLGLVLALVAGAWGAKERVETLTNALSTTVPNWSTIFLQAFLMIASVGAPIWFAWLATKQIGQRFRLAEDYSFKASVARAYEGYRKEAARIDESFESRLFESALTRLEEAPLRLVELEAHGSPWHEFLESEAFMKALEVIPELRARAAKLPKSAQKSVKTALSKVPRLKKDQQEQKTEASPTG